MPAAGVPGFFGQNRRRLRPVGLDLTFVYDTSGSMNAVNNFIRQISTARRIEFALRDQLVGIQQPNRYSQSEMSVELSFGGQRWVTGDQILGNLSSWNNPTAGGILTGNDEEDVTGSARAIAESDRGYRDGIQRIMLSFSDEQSGSDLDVSNAVIDALTDPVDGQIFIAASGITLTISPTPAGAPGAGWEPFGLVYTTQTTGVAIYRNTSTNAVEYVNVPIADTTWASGGTAFAVDGNLILPGGSLSQLVNTPKLAYLTGGAVYAIDDMTSSAALDAFGQSIGTVLGSLLYSLLS